MATAAEQKLIDAMMKKVANPTPQPIKGVADITSRVANPTPTPIKGVADINNDPFIGSGIPDRFKTPTPAQPVQPPARDPFTQAPIAPITPPQERDPFTQAPIYTQPTPQPTPQPTAQPTIQPVQPTQPQLTGNIVSYKDASGNLQQLDAYYEASGQVPQGWTKSINVAIPPVPQPQYQPKEYKAAAPYQQFVPTSREGDIQAQYKANTDALTAALKQRIAESIQSQTGLISTAGQRYDPLKAQSELAKEQQLRSTMEQASLSGDRGGISRQEALGVRVGGEQRLGDINLQQQNFVNQANTEIARLNNEGRFQEAQIMAEQKSKELQDIMADRMRRDEITRSEALRADTLAREDARYREGLAREDEAIFRGDARYQSGLALDESLRQQDIAKENEVIAKKYADSERQASIATLPQYSRDYQARINQVTTDNDPSNDWEVPYLNMLRQDKIAGIESSKAKSEQESYDRYIAEQKRQDAINAAATKAEADRKKLEAELNIKQQTANKPKVTKPVAQPMW